MKRRSFFRMAAGSAGMLWTSGLERSLQALAQDGTSSGVRRVLVMFKCHFDAGFIDTQTAVVHKYFSQYFPQAIRVAQQSREPGQHRYVWTTGSWLLYEYLEQASPQDRRIMEDAIAAGDIAWHAIPFNWQTEMMDASMISASIGLSHALDARFGRRTTGAKMTDVPGHTRGIVAPVAAEGVKFLDIGVNDASTPADVPPLFLWKDSTGASLVVMYHSGYGGITVVQGSDLAVVMVVRGDNSGPHTPEEIAKVYADLGARFPGADIVATNLSEIANAVDPLRSHLPVVTQEIGDTWIYGVASDPVKVARYRELARLRRSWIQRGAIRSGDATDLRMLRQVLLEAEHTWGTDTKTWLDFDHYVPADLAAMLDTKNYKVVEFSWQEKRQDLFDGIDTLPETLRTEARTRIDQLTPKEPQLAGAKPHPPEQTLETEHFLVALDPATGAIRQLRNKSTQTDWADAAHPLALLTYQTLSPADYSRFFANYIISTADWAKKDFGKPNIERFGAESQEWHPAITRLDVAEDAGGHRLQAQLAIKDPQSIASGRAAFPRAIFLELSFPKEEPVVQIALSWFGKPATRMPEALWLTFNPIVANPNGWTMDKSGESISPLDVVAAGSRHLHAVSTGFANQSGGRSFAVETLDAPLIAVGERSPLNFSREQPDLSTGIHCSLFNNAWGTNYIMWFGEDMRFRLVLHA